MPEIKAIETRYKGYRFRSRLEARWAVAFDSLGIKWEYELEGYDLDEAGWYLPDFWLPEAFCWAEVKPIRLNELEVKKVKALVQMTGYPVYLLIGTPSDCGGYPAVRPANDGGFDIDHWLYLGSIAVGSAKSARFEHGESG